MGICIFDFTTPTHFRSVIHVICLHQHMLIRVIYTGTSCEEKSLIDSSVKGQYAPQRWFRHKITLDGCIVTLPPRPPRYINFFEPFHFTAGDQLVVPIGVSHISLRLQEIQSREWEKKNKRTNEQNAWVNSSARRELCNTVFLVCICRLTLAWISSKNSTTLLECRLILTCLPSLLWTSSHLTGLSAPVSTGHSRPPSLTASSSSFVQLSSSVPLSTSGHPRSRVKTLCLVSHQNRQRNRLLGGPPT